MRMLNLVVRFTLKHQRNFNILLKINSENLLDKDLVYGSELFFNQILAMGIKKFYYTIRNYVMLLIMFFIPILFLVITMAFQGNFKAIIEVQFLILIQNLDMLTGTDNLPELRISFEEYIRTVTVYETLTPDDTLNPIINSYRNFFTTLSAEHTLISTETGISMEETILTKYRESMSNVNLNYMVGTTFATDAITVWFNNQAYHTVPLTVNLINNAILKATLGGEYSITLSNKPLPFSLSTTVSLRVPYLEMLFKIFFLNSR